MKKRFLLSVMLALSLLVAACGGSGNSQTSESQNSVMPGDATAIDQVLPGDATAIDQVMPGDATAIDTTAEPEGMVGTGTPEAATTIPVTGGDVNHGYRLSNLLNYTIVDTQGNELGVVTDLVVSLSGPSIEYVVAGASGFLGIGEKNLLVPFDHFSVSINNAARQFVFDGEADMFSGSPDVELFDLNFAAADWDADYVDYWDDFTSVVQPALPGSTPQASVTGVVATPLPPDPNLVTNENSNNNDDDNNNDSDDKYSDDTPNDNVNGNANSNSNSNTNDNNNNTGNVNGNSNGNLRDEDSFVANPASFNFALASELLDARVLDLGQFMTSDVLNNDSAVRAGPGQPATTNDNTNDNSNNNDNANNNMNEALPSAVPTTSTSDDAQKRVVEEIGKVVEAYVDPESGIFNYIVVAGTQRLGTADRWIPIPFSHVRLFAEPNNTDKNNVHDVVVVISSDVLSAAPNYEVDGLPDVAVNGWDTDLRSYWDTVVP